MAAIIKKQISITSEYPSQDLTQDEKPETSENFLETRINDLFRSSAGDSPFKREQKIDAELQEFYKKILSDKPKHIIINVCDCDGFGDILAALKFADIIKKSDPTINLAIVFEDEVTMRKTESVASEYPYLKNCYLLENLPVEFKNPKSGLCVGVASFYEISSSDLQYDRMGLDRDYPYLKLPEYSCLGVPNNFLSNLKITGLGDHEYGIFVDRTLISKVKSDRKQQIDPVTHVSELSDNTLQSQILNGRKIDSYSSEANLYFGYGHYVDSHFHFIRSVMELEKVNNKNIDMVLIVDDPQELQSKIFLDTQLQKELEEQGIGKIDIVHPTTKGGMFTSSMTLSRSQKTLRIITRSKIAHCDFETCLLMSQPLTLITGDQSLSEAISTDKIILYELYRHKIGLGQSLIKLANKLALPLVAEYFTHTITPVPGLSISEFGFIKSEDYHRISSQFLLNNEFKQQWRKFIAYIRKNKSLNDKFLLLMIRKLACNYFPKIQAIYDRHLL